jgi:hypothetical protein
MRRILLRLLICSVVAWVVTAVWSAGLAERRSRAVLAQVEGDPAGVVDFARVGPSDWERVYFFHPYTPPEYIQRSLGFRWPDVDQTSIASNDGVNLVVFVRDERVVGWFEHARNRGDLKELATAAGFPRDRAQFRVSHDQEGRAVLFP